MFVWLVFLVFSSGGVYAQDVSCSKQFCDDYLVKNDCPELPKNCLIQNSTHNGIVLPYPDPCNCCDYCLENRKEGDDCAVGSAITSAPNNICGSGLFCQNSKCRPMAEVTEKDCPLAQKKYDDQRKDGSLGHMQVRPNCDREGQYETWRCIPGEICYCVNELGERIFGEIPFTDVAHVLLKCGCSRKLDSMQRFLGREIQRHEFLRCAPDGNYDPIQCVDGLCMCVDKKTGNPEYPRDEPIPIIQISEKNLKCFDPKIHYEFDYYKTCENNLMKTIEKLVEAKNEYDQVLAYLYPSCGPDGTFAPIQKSETHKYCVDHDGKKMDGYIVDIASPEAQNMNCKCARASLIVIGPEKPECDTSGNYKPVQCRRGLCRCVDADGNQIKKEVPEAEQDSLHCP